VTMDMARSVTANFAPQETLTVSKNGDGKGLVTSSPTGIHCGSQCVFAYAQGTFVTLTATASRGSKFTGWSGTCGDPGNCAVTLNASTAAVATFQAQCVVPNVLGQPLSKAQERLKAAHCSTGKVTSAYSDKLGKGRVISQRPHGARVRPRGARVNLVVSKGRRH